MLQAASLTALAGIRHGFFTRDGGVSDGLYASLNGGAEDNTENDLAINLSSILLATDFDSDTVAAAKPRKVRRVSICLRAWRSVRGSGSSSSSR